MTAPVIVTTHPFAEVDVGPRTLLEQAGIAFNLNPLRRKLQPDEVAGVIGDHRVVIAGTERIDRSVMEACPALEAICRVGIGLDSVDLCEARDRGIRVSYTPEGPSPAVAELTIGLMLDCLRGISRTDGAIRIGRWQRFAGRRIERSTIGIVGVGRIGRRVLRHLSGGFPGANLLAYDTDANARQLDLPHLQWAECLEDLLVCCDVVSLHVPLSPQSYGLLNRESLSKMKPGAILINTSRGGIVDEKALSEALTSGLLQAAAIDVFEQEPYSGPLCQQHAAVLTAHMGSMTEDCRAAMELEATESAIRFLQGKPFVTPVPESEFEQRLSGMKG